jgi:hypothetical protein
MCGNEFEYAKGMGGLPLLFRNRSTRAHTPLFLNTPYAQLVRTPISHCSPKPQRYLSQSLITGQIDMQCSLLLPTVPRVVQEADPSAVCLIRL